MTMMKLITSPNVGSCTEGICLFQSHVSYLMKCSGRSDYQTIGPVHYVKTNTRYIRARFVAEKIKTTHSFKQLVKFLRVSLQLTINSLSMLQPANKASHSALPQTMK